jgi:hypothetical protein
MYKDYGNMLDTLYCNFEPGTIRVNHIFKVHDMDGRMEMQCYTHEDSACVRQPMLKRGAKVGVEHLLEMKNFSLETLKAPGLRDIKQVELYKKWRQYVDPQYWDEMCPEPSAAVMQHVKSDKADKPKQTIERANSSMSEQLQEQARKSAKMEKKKAEKEIKMTQMKAAREEKEQKKATKAAVAANKRTEIKQNHIKREEKRAGQASEQQAKQASKSAKKSKQ